MEPVSSRCAKILLYLKISIKWGSVLLRRTSSIPHRKRKPAPPALQFCEHKHTYAHTKEVPPLPAARTVSSDNSGMLDATSVFSEKCCNWVCSTEEDLKFKLGRFARGCCHLYDNYNYTTHQPLPYSATYSNYKGDAAAYFQGLFRFNPDLCLTFILLFLSN